MCLTTVSSDELGVSPSYANRLTVGMRPIFSEVLMALFRFDCSPFGVCLPLAALC